MGAEQCGFGRLPAAATGLSPTITGAQLSMAVDRVTGCKLPVASATDRRRPIRGPLRALRPYHCLFKFSAGLAEAPRRPRREAPETAEARRGARPILNCRGAKYEIHC